MICSGVGAISGAPLRLSFDKLIETAARETAAGEFGAAPAAYVAPGFIDIQVNGFAGVDYNWPGAPLEEIARSIRAMFATGVTRFLPTVITGAEEDMLGALRNLARAKAELDEGAAIEGIHVEGPHISPEDGPRGAHPKRWVRRPDLNEFRRMQDAAQGLVRLVTLSPEWPEAPGYIEAAVAEGITISIGHTNASAAQIAAAVTAGATLSTHLGNGAHGTLPRHPNYIWEQLAEDRLAASFIVDGIHLPASFLKVALRAKGAERAVLVTDAVTAAGCAPGRYRLGEQEVELAADNSVRLPNGRLAGSALLMHRGVANLLRLGGLSLRDAVRAATVNPARVAQIARRQQGLAPGDRGDVVEFRLEGGEITVLRTWLDGRLVYGRG